MKTKGRKEKKALKKFIIFKPKSIGIIYYKPKKRKNKYKFIKFCDTLRRLDIDSLLILGTSSPYLQRLLEKYISRIPIKEVGLNKLSNCVNLYKGKVGIKRTSPIKLKPNKRIKPLSKLSLRLHQNNINKMNLNKMVCVKDLTDNTVRRIPKWDADFRVDNSDGLLEYTTKKEYKEYLAKKFGKKWNDGLHIITTQGSIRSTYDGRNRKARRWFNIKIKKHKILNKRNIPGNFIIERDEKGKILSINRIKGKPVLRKNRKCLQKTSTKIKTWRCPNKKTTYTISPIRLKRLKIEAIRKLK